MPVNIYKGEASRNSEKKIGLEVNLDHNPGLWEKISFLNITDLDDHRDLIRFSKSVKDAESSNETMNQLLKFQNHRADLLIEFFCTVHTKSCLWRVCGSRWKHRQKIPNLTTSSGSWHPCHPQR